MKLLFFLSLFFFIVSCSSDKTESLFCENKENVLRVYLSEFKEHDNDKTRAVIRTFDFNNKLDYLYQNGDKASAFNLSNPQLNTVLTYDEEYNAFCGVISSSISDEIDVIYPQNNSKLENKRILLTLPYQDGTLSMIAKNVHRWGYTHLAENNVSFFSGRIVLNTLMSICKVYFYHEGNVIDGITSLRLTTQKGDFYKNRYLNLYTGALEEGDCINTITIENSDGMNTSNSPVFLCFFPSAFSMTVYLKDLKGNEYKAAVEMRKYISDQYNIMNIQCSKISEGEKNTDYIEVCGVKWAKGNLYYSETLFGNNGFQQHFSLAPNQSYFPHKASLATASFNDMPTETCLFGWGASGLNATSKDNYSTGYGNISGKMYKDRNCTIETNDYESAKYGDVAFWASYGKYRMPTAEEMNKLFSESSYSIGYFTDSEGRDIFGYLFTTPQGKREVNTNVKYFTVKDLENGLFLPACGYREGKTDIINGLGSYGYYYHGEYGSSICQLRFKGKNFYWSETSPVHGRAIRPVKNDIIIKEEIHDYIDLCGIKWAKSNLQYDVDKPASDGFQSHWFINDQQWYYYKPHSNRKYEQRIYDSNHTCHFNFGVCGINATKCDVFSTGISDISGKMFLDRACTHETNDFSLAKYGDLAYWASHGKYRLPTKDELYRLFAESSYSYGYYLNSDGIYIMGYLFKNADGNREISRGMQIYTDYDLNHYLFLPLCGYREGKSTDLLHVGNYAFYSMSVQENPMFHLALKGYFAEWRVTYPFFGRCIRPVLIR